MKIYSIAAEKFMLFDKINIDFSSGINVIFGENSTGKTALIKVLYSSSKLIADDHANKEELEKILLEKMVGVFRPDKSSIGRLAYRHKGVGAANVGIKFDKDNYLNFSFTSRQSNHLDIDVSKGKNNFTPIFIPPKEIISSTGVFPSLYERYHIDFEETYYDLCKLLLLPLKKGKNTDEQNTILSNVSEIVNGNVVQRDNHFFLKVRGQGEFEMGLVSEGYRKLSTLTYLILSGSLNKNSILFWDEPETNMNPKMIYHIANTLVELAKMGVQVFITTHSYFVQQAFNLISSYSNDNKKAKIKFISLYRNDEGNVRYESGNTLDDIEHNAIMDEFDCLYDREQDMMG